MVHVEPVGELEDAISKAYIGSTPTLIADHALQIKNERIPSYIVIERDQLFVNSRKTLLLGELDLRTLQYLFVTKSGRDRVRAFARDLLHAGYRDVAFLMFDDDQAIGTIVRANATGNEITLKSVGSCNSVMNDLDQIPAFAADSHRFCPLGGCTVKYRIVTDATVSFWREEDTLRLKRNETLKAVGAQLMEDFGYHHNLTIDPSAGINVPWPKAFQELVDRETDVIAGPKPEDPRILDNLEVVCWYMFRDMVLADLVRVKSIENDLLAMLTPFHYLVWLCVFLVFAVYALLLIALGKLSSMGLISERVKFAYVCAISLSQGVPSFPRNFGLRLVLLLWMVFSLYLSIAYNSTFTSSLARVETEDLLEDLEQVRDSGQPLAGPAMVRSYFNDSDDRFVRDLYERYKVIRPEEALNSVFLRNGIAVLQRFTVDRMNWNYRNNRSLRMYALPKPVFRFPVFFFARKGYIYRKPLRQLVTRYRETGMLRKLDSVLMIEEDKQIALGQATDEILTMKHLRPVFEIFFMCQGVGCAIFLLELLLARLSRTS